MSTWIGWILFGLVIVVWQISKVNYVRRRTEQADFIAMLLVAQDAYELNRDVFIDWLMNRSAGRTEQTLWLSANYAVENMVRSWAANTPSSLGVAELLWDAKHGDIGDIDSP